MFRTAFSPRWLLLGLPLLLAPFSGPHALVAAGRDDERVRVTVVAILAHDRDNVVDEKLRGIAEEVRKIEPRLTGFRIERFSSESLAVGATRAFPLVEDAKVKVTVEEKLDGRICLTIHPPRYKGSVKYSCTCGKFVPIITRYKTAANETLIVGVMAQPCRKKHDCRD